MPWYEISKPKRSTNTEVNILKMSQEIPGRVKNTTVNKVMATNVKLIMR